MRTKYIIWLYNGVGYNWWCKLFHFYSRYGGLKQSRSCYEKESTKKMCTTINCEFQNTGRECNETITRVEVCFYYS